MSDSSNVAVVRKFYENLSAPEVLMQVLSPTIRWEIVSGFPYGGEYLGVQAVFQDFFGRVLQDFDEWRTVANEVHDAGDHVVALGTYSGRAKTTARPSSPTSLTYGPSKMESWFACNNARTLFSWRELRDSLNEGVTDEKR
jgi:ketosteroid isomerase-like protein